MAKRPRLMDRRGNAMLVSGSIYQACKFYELFAQTVAVHGPKTPLRAPGSIL
jgi:hypothetical protein